MIAHHRFRAPKRESWRRLQTLLCAASLSACVSTTGRLEQNRFQHETYPYALFYTPDGRPEQPLGPYWELSNFHSPDGKRLYAKTGPEYTILRRYDPSTHGSANPTRSELFYDVLLTRTQPRDQASMWVRTAPMAPSDAQTPLADLADRYLIQAQKAGRAAAPFGLEVAGSDGAKHAGQLKRLGSTPCTLSKRDALRVDFGFGSPEAIPERRASVVLVRSGYWASGTYPVLMLIGRSWVQTTPELEERMERDFDELLEHVVLGDKGQGLSMHGGHTCSTLREDQASPPSSGGEAPIAPRSEPGSSSGELEQGLEPEPAQPLPDPDAAGGDDAPAPEAPDQALDPGAPEAPEYGMPEELEYEQ